jgi:hypothetical protein
VGTVARVLSLDVRLTVKGVVRAAGILTDPFTAPTPSVAFAGMVSANGG